jgi:hypothetical protein
MSFSADLRFAHRLDGLKEHGFVRGAPIVLRPDNERVLAEMLSRVAGERKAAGIPAHSADGDRRAERNANSPPQAPILNKNELCSRPLIGLAKGPGRPVVHTPGRIARSLQIERTELQDGEIADDDNARQGRRDGEEPLQKMRASLS